MALCEKIISQAIDQDCANPIFTGLEQVGYIINRGDIASMTRSDSIVSAITMVSAKKAYRIYQETKTPFNGSNTEFAEGAVTNKVNKNVSFVILNDGSKVVENQVEGLLNGEFVVVLARKWVNANEDNKFEIIGSETGAKCTALSKDPNSADTDGGWAVTLTETNAPSAEVFFFDTDAATSLAALEALC